MIAQWLWHYLVSNWVEVTGWSTTLVGIWLTTRRNLWCWPITLVADVIYLIVFYRAQLLSDALLQVFFIVFTIYGWWNWANGVRQEGTVRIAPLPISNAVIAILAGVAGTFVLASIAMRLHASLPYLDAALASFSLVASWWDARRHIANWWLWIVVDAFYVVEYVLKSMWFTTVLYALLIGLAVLGLRDWRRAPVTAQTAS
jgi:nicotinamide mononucleotide transporter